MNLIVAENMKGVIDNWKQKPENENMNLYLSIISSILNLVIKEMKEKKEDNI